MLSSFDPESNFLEENVKIYQYLQVRKGNAQLFKFHSVVVFQKHSTVFYKMQNGYFPGCIRTASCN